MGQGYKTISTQEEPQPVRYNGAFNAIPSIYIHHIPGFQHLFQWPSLITCHRPGLFGLRKTSCLEKICKYEDGSRIEKTYRK